MGHPQHHLEGVINYLRLVCREEKRANAMSKGKLGCGPALRWSNAAPRHGVTTSLGACDGYIYTSIILGHYLLKVHDRNIHQDADPIESATQTADRRPIAGLLGAFAAIGVFVIALNLAA